MNNKKKQFKDNNKRYSHSRQGSQREKPDNEILQYQPKQQPKIQGEWVPAQNKESRKTPLNIQTLDIEKQLYDIKILLENFFEQPLVPESINTHMKDYSQFFVKTPLQPVSLKQLTSNNHQNKNQSMGSQHQPTLQRSNQNQVENQNQKQQKAQRKYSEESDPEWLNEDSTQSIPTKLEFLDIEQDLNEKRQKYQRLHGTFEKKQKEKEEKQRILEESKIYELSQIEQQNSYNSLKAQIQKSNDESIPTSVLTLFKEHSNNQENLELKVEKVFTLEEIEQNLQLSSTKHSGQSQSQPQQQTSVKQESLIIQQVEDQQEKFDVNEFMSSLQTFNNPKQQSVNPKLEDWKNIQVANSRAQQIHYMQMQSNQQRQFVTSYRQIPLDQVQIQTRPFSIQSYLLGQRENDPICYYIDQQNKVQGPFSSVKMDQWFQQGYLKMGLNISFIQPCNWVTLEKIFKNLEQIRIAQLTQHNQVQPKYNQQFPQTMDQYKIQQYHQMQQIQQQLPQFQRQQLAYLQMYQQFQTQNQSLNNTSMQKQNNQQLINNQETNQKQLSNSEQEQLAEQHLYTVFNIGKKKLQQNISPQVLTNQQPLNLNQNEFPALGEGESQKYP